MKHIRTALRILAADRTDDQPPPEYLYHATPYAQEILSSGFEIKPARQTFGGHGQYVSLTTYDNAMAYAKDLKIVIGFLNDELSWEELEDILARRGLKRALKGSLNNCAFNELQREPYSVWDDEKAKYNRERYPKDVPDNPHSYEFFNWAYSFYVAGREFEGSSVSAERELHRRWNVLKGLSAFSHSTDGSFVLLSGSSASQQLLGKSMDEVKVVKVAVAPATAYEERGWKPSYWSREKDQDPKGKYTYNYSEEEWRYYDTSDLWPVEAYEVPL